MIEGLVVGDREVAARFRRLTPAIVQGLAVVMRRLMIRLQARVKEQKLSGQVLRNRTGALRRSVAQDVSVGGDTITGRVGIFRGPTLAYAGVHEFGGTMSVSAHLRTITQAWGRQLAAPVTVTVSAHDRTVPERSYLRTALREMHDEIVAELDRSVSDHARRYGWRETR